MITNKDEAKAMKEHISCDCKCKFSSTTYNSKQKWNNKTWVIASAKNIIDGTLTNVFVRIISI